MIWFREEFFITDEREKVVAERVAEMLGSTYWGHKRPLSVVRRLIPHSLCLSLFHGDRQVGFARVVSDYTVFSWLSDVVIDALYRGRGLGKWLVSCALGHVDVAGTQFVLQTRDAFVLYEGLGFSRSEKLMSRPVSDGRKGG